MATTAAGAESASGDKEEILIGCIQDLSGPNSEWGQASVWGTEYAARLCNESGGVNGRMIKIVPMDSKSDVQETLVVYRRLIDEYKVDAIVGPPVSTVMLGISPMTEEDKISIVGHFQDDRVTVDEMTGKAWNYMFLAQPSSSQQAELLADYAMKELGATKFAALYDQGNAFSINMYNPFVKYVEANGCEMVASEAFQTTDKDYRAQITKIVDANPDIVYLPCYAASAALAYDQLREAGYKGNVLGGNTLAAPFNTLCKQPLENIYFFQNYDMDSALTAPLMEAYLEETGAKYKKMNAGFGYDDMQLMIDAMKRMDNPKAQKYELNTYIEQCKDVPSASGTITMNKETHRPSNRPLYIVYYPGDGALDFVVVQEYSVGDK